MDVGHQAVCEAIQDGGYRGMTETEIAGLAAYAMRKAGSEWEWSFTGGKAYRAQRRPVRVLDQP